MLSWKLPNMRGEFLQVWTSRVSCIGHWEICKDRLTSIRPSYEIEHLTGWERCVSLLDLLLALEKQNTYLTRLQRSVRPRNSDDGVTHQLARQI